MNNIKVSVTIPTYNTSKFLPKCLDSMKAQTIKDIEFIIVDDGSTDGSGAICDEYAIQDCRFKVFHQQNGGSAIARETGLKNAIGEFVIVCDSDDWAEPNMYELLYETAKKHNADIVICGFYTEYDHGRQITNFIKFKENNGIVDNDDIIARGAGWSWVKLIRRSLLTNNNIHYEYGINLSEDALITYKIMKLNPKVVQITKPLYHYRRVFGGTSYTNKITMNHIFQLHYTYLWLKENYNEKKWKNIVRHRAVDIVFACLRSMDIDKNFFCHFLSTELKWRYFFQKFFSLKVLIVYSCKILPVSIPRQLVKIMYRFVYSQL